MNALGPIRASTVRGFTMVELVVVILVLGVLAGVAAPRLIQTTEDAAANATVTQIRSIFTAVEVYAAEHGRLPANVATGVLPPDLRGRVPERVFTEPSPIGGYYDWNGPGTTVDTYGVTVSFYPANRPRGVLTALDNAYDDGDADTGWIRRHSSNSINFVLDDK